MMKVRATLIGPKDLNDRCRWHPSILPLREKVIPCTYVFDENRIAREVRLGHLMEALGREVILRSEELERCKRFLRASLTELQDALRANDILMDFEGLEIIITVIRPEHVLWCEKSTHIHAINDNQRAANDNVPAAEFRLQNHE